MTPGSSRSPDPTARPDEVTHPSSASPPERAGRTDQPPNTRSEPHPVSDRAPRPLTGASKGARHVAAISLGPAREGPGRIRRWARSWTHSRSEEHTSELQSLMRISYAVFCLTNKKSTQ